VPKERIFCVPGNHDIDREKEKFCFLGARGHLDSQNRIDLLLEPAADLCTLFRRQHQYRKFIESYFSGQKREPTRDGLGYVSLIEINEVNIAIVGLDSAWLSEGGPSDHGNLLIGERQVINALDLARSLKPHVTIAMAHHPFHILQDFDRRPAQRRIEQDCQFFHCGHLHEPESRAAGFTSSGCLTLSAGASFETRSSHNAYSFVTLDLLEGKRSVTPGEYNPSQGKFAAGAPSEYPIEITPVEVCAVGKLAAALSAFDSRLNRLSHYLAALLLDQKSEILISGANGSAFGSISVMAAQPGSELKRKSLTFMGLRNIVRLLYPRVPLADLLSRHGAPALEYGVLLESMCATDTALSARLAQQEADAQAMASVEPRSAFSNTASLFADLAASGDWSLLREQAERYMTVADESARLIARRMLALSLANSEEPAEKSQAIALYRTILDEGCAEAVDLGNLALLILDKGEHDAAKTVILDGLRDFSEDYSGYFSRIGQKIIEATGDRDFRKKLESHIGKRGDRDARK
jgi:hypothetical protein